MSQEEKTKAAGKNIGRNTADYLVCSVRYVCVLGWSLRERGKKEEKRADEGGGNDFCSNEYRFAENSADKTVTPKIRIGQVLIDTWLERRYPTIKGL